MKPLLSEEDLWLIDLAVAAAPPLTDEQVNTIRDALRPWEWLPLKQRAGDTTGKAA